MKLKDYIGVIPLHKCDIVYNRELIARDYLGFPYYCKDLEREVIQIHKLNIEKSHGVEYCIFLGEII